MKQNELHDLMAPAAEAALDKGLTYAQAQFAFVLSLARVACDRSTTQGEAARLLAVSQAHLSRLMRGKVSAHIHAKKPRPKKRFALKNGLTPAQAIGVIEL